MYARLTTVPFIPYPIFIRHRHYCLLKRVKFEVFSIVSYAESRNSNYRGTAIKRINFQRKNNGYIILDQNKFLKGFVVKLKVTLITSTFPLKLRTGD